MFMTSTTRLKRSRLGETPTAPAFSLSRLISSPLWGGKLHQLHIKTNSFFPIIVIRKASSAQCSLVTQSKAISRVNSKRKFTKDWISEKIFEMRLFVTIFFAVVSVSTAQHQQEVDPAYLRQYYAQIAQQSGAEQRGAAPIYEQQEQPQYHQQAAPLRNVSYFPPLFELHKRVVCWESRSHRDFSRNSSQSRSFNSNKPTPRHNPNISHASTSPNRWESCHNCRHLNSKSRNCAVPGDIVCLRRW